MEMIIDRSRPSILFNEGMIDCPMVSWVSLLIISVSLSSEGDWDGHVM